VYYEHLGFDLSADGAFERLGREWTDAYEASRFACPLHAGAREILAAVRAAEYTQSILSAYPMERLKEIVGHFGLTGHFMQVLGLDDIWARSKVELGHRWLAELALPPSRVILIGDTVHDWDVAQALGIDCALVATGHQSVERLRRKTARVFDSLAELPGVLRIPAAG
jgi:phosphoglycolate phosphatase